MWLPFLLAVNIILWAGCSQVLSGTDPQIDLEEPYLSDVGDTEDRGGRSTEEMVLASSAIARVELLGMSTTTVAAAHETDVNRTLWAAALEFRFRVLEYLKGSGASEISVLVTGESFYSTEAEARSQLERLQAAHDTTWDDREAILFLDSSWWRIPSLGSGRYYIGTIEYDGTRDYTIDARTTKVWLPAAARSSGSTSRGRTAQATTTDPLYLLDVPGSGSGSTRTRAAGASTSTEADTAPTIRLSALKKLIADLLAEASAGGTDLYRQCVEFAYEQERKLRHEIEKTGTAARRIGLDSISSGLPAGTILWESISGAPTEDNHGRHWFEGTDKDIVNFEAADFRTSPEDSSYLWYTPRIVTARPLPAGSYQFFYNSQGWFELICDKYSELQRNLFDARLNVTAPERTLHEAFFDPVDIGTAVGADGSNGVLEPNAFALNGTNTTISSLKWEDGAVTMTLSPTASLADYAIDFIDTTGTTTLSLTSDNASTTALTWTVPDKPWADGDLLMLRIHKPISNDATLSALALNGVDITFSTATTTYTASVPATTTQTTVTPTTNHASATYVVKLAGVTDLDGTIPLAAGANVITIDVTAEDAVTTQTYTVTVTRATPTEPITVTLSPRVDGSSTYVNIAIEWNDPLPCDGQYMVALYTSSDYVVRFMGFHPAPETTSLSRELYTRWDLQFFPDRWAGVSCDPSDYSGRRHLGRVSLRAVHPDNN